MYYYPLSYFPKGGNDFLTPSPLGEGREGGHSQETDNLKFELIDSRFQKLTCIFYCSLSNLTPAQ